MKSEHTVSNPRRAHFQAGGTTTKSRTVLGIRVISKGEEGGGFGVGWGGK